MGWKRIRDHFRLTHLVHVREGHVVIGVPYIPELLRLDSDGTVVVMRPSLADGRETRAVIEALRNDQETVRRLLAEPDVFTQSTPVYRTEQGAVIEHQAEEIGWPNVTHDGHLMYDNEFFLSRADAITHGLANARAGVAYAKERLEQRTKDLEQAQALLADAETTAAALEALAAAAAPSSPRTP